MNFWELCLNLDLTDKSKNRKMGPLGWNFVCGWGFCKSSTLIMGKQVKEVEKKGTQKEDLFLSFSLDVSLSTVYLKQVHWYIPEGFNSSLLLLNYGICIPQHSRPLSTTFIRSDNRFLWPLLVWPYQAFIHSMWAKGHSSKIATNRLLMNVRWCFISTRMIWHDSGQYQILINFPSTFCPCKFPELLSSHSISGEQRFNHQSTR